MNVNRKKKTKSKHKTLEFEACYQSELNQPKTLFIIASWAQFFLSLFRVTNRSRLSVDWPEQKNELREYYSGSEEKKQIKRKTNNVTLLHQFRLNNAEDAELFF